MLNKHHNNLMLNCRFGRCLEECRKEGYGSWCSTTASTTASTTTTTPAIITTATVARF